MLESASVDRSAGDVDVTPVDDNEFIERTVRHIVASEIPLDLNQSAFHLYQIGGANMINAASGRFLGCWLEYAPRHWSHDDILAGDSVYRCNFCESLVHALASGDFGQRQINECAGMPFIVSMLSELAVVPSYFPLLLDAGFPLSWMAVAPNITFLEVRNFTATVLGCLGDLNPCIIADFVGLASKRAPVDPFARSFLLEAMEDIPDLVMECLIHVFDSNQWTSNVVKLGFALPLFEQIIRLKDHPEMERWCCQVLDGLTIVSEFQLPNKFSIEESVLMMRIIRLADGLDTSWEFVERCHSFMLQSEGWLLENMSEFGVAMRIEAGKWLLEIMMWELDDNGESYHDWLEGEEFSRRLVAMGHGDADEEMERMVNDLIEMIEQNDPESSLIPLLEAFLE
jgi:hypothetical protein